MNLVEQARMYDEAERIAKKKISDLDNAEAAATRSALHKDIFVASHGTVPSDTMAAITDRLIMKGWHK